MARRLGRRPPRLHRPALRRPVDPVVFAVLFVFFSIRADAFLTTNNLVNISRQVAPTVIVAMAMTFVITTGAIDLSVGSIVGLTAAPWRSWPRPATP